ncbi:type II toxin-antitoxin system VapB family antitoxin [Rhodoplanes azumiensis]|uniref:Type II toxin-antitoxin system VapB family antitoxin n=1 Tax=Rhodoplanes azumiensis TaxID=1897628 RepID=A0ABW5AK57_9BRAD
MALFIRDPAVDALAEEVRRLTRARTKTEAVRNALLAQLAQARRALPMRDRLARAQALADSMGPSDPTVDLKAWSDAMWDER